MLVAYLRVSTQKQGASGLGLEAQREAVERYAASIGQPIIATFTEVESGAVRTRRELASALELCRKRKAILLIAKLDRLSRSVAFVAQLLEANVEIRAADMPAANRMVLQLLAVFAEHERQMIRDRTRAALAAAKARGIELGKHGKVLARENALAATRYASDLAATIDMARRSGAQTHREIARWLNEARIPAREGGEWHASSAGRVLKRLDQWRRPRGNASSR